MWFVRFRQPFGVIPMHEATRVSRMRVLWLVIPNGSIKRSSSKSFVDDLILGRGGVRIRAVLHCEVLSLIPN